MEKKILAENLYEFLSENLEADSHFGREIDTNTEDFIWNEVITWLMDQMKSSGIKFKYSLYRQQGTHIRFDNNGGVHIECKMDSPHYGRGWYVKFSINQEPIFSYHVNSVNFKEKQSFKYVFDNDQYKRYSLDGAKIKDQWVKAGFSNFKDLTLKKKVWKAKIDSGEYLKQDISFKQVLIDKKELSYQEVADLSKTIIKAFKTNFLYKNFIKGVNKDKLNKKLARQSVKAGLTIDSVVNFLESTSIKHESTKQDRGGPWATTGTSEGIDNFDISALQKAYPETNKFLIDNAEAIFKGLQKKKYSHSLGYYTFKKAGINGNKFQILVSCTTYHN